MWGLIAAIFKNGFSSFYDLNLVWLTSIWPVREYFYQPPKLSIRENKEGNDKYEIEITFTNKGISTLHLPSALQME